MKYERINVTRHGTATIRREVPALLTGADRRRYFSAASENAGLEFAGINYSIEIGEKDAGKFKLLTNLVKHQKSEKFRVKSVEMQKNIIIEIRRLHKHFIFSDDTRGYVLGPIYRQTERLLESYGHWL